MADGLSAEKRSWLMSCIRGKNTKPEMKVRKLAHAMGFRFRLYRREMPGTPDLVFPKMRVVIFVHGCFWHRHPGCSKASTPKSNTDFWSQKFKRNVERDAVNYALLEEAGWKVAVIWECETRDQLLLESKLRLILEGRNE